MIKLADLIENNNQPGEKSKLKNYLYRGSKDQIDQMTINPYTVVGSSKGTIEGKGMIDTSNHPENKNKVVPFSWSEDSLFEETDMQRLLLGREFETLADLKKMVYRLRQTQAQSDIEDFILNYIN